MGDPRTDPEHTHLFMVVSEGDGHAGLSHDDDLEWQVEARTPEEAAAFVFAGSEVACEIDGCCPHELAAEDDDPNDPEYPVNGKCSAWLLVYDLDNPSPWTHKVIRYESGRVEYFGMDN